MVMAVRMFRGLQLLLLILFVMGLWACQAHRPDPAPAPYPVLPPSVDKPPTQRSYEVFGKRYTPIDTARGFRETGIASWYGYPFHGRKTSNGEIYDMHAQTAAHKTLPMGTFLLVRNLENDRKTIVRINDRGPFVDSRIIDLSFRSAKKIDMIEQGTAQVEIISLEPDAADFPAYVKAAHPDYFFPGDFTVQVGAYADQERAQAMRRQLADFGKDVFVTSASVGGQTLFRVRIGRFSSMKDAERLKRLLAQNGYENVFAVSVEK